MSQESQPANGTESDYDYAVRDTSKHIRRVQGLIAEAMGNLQVRMIEHDASKWSEEEWPYFARNTARLARMEYGSQEYGQSLLDLGPGLEHHYESNDHHPQFYGENFWHDVTMFGLIEMLADWKAAGERHPGGSLRRSIEINKDRFGMPEWLVSLLTRTAKELGWF